MNPTRGKAPGRYYREGVCLLDRLEMFPDEESAELWFEIDRWEDTRLYCPAAAPAPRRFASPPPESPCPSGVGTVASTSRFARARPWSTPDPPEVVGHRYLPPCDQPEGGLQHKAAPRLRHHPKSAWFMLHPLRMAYESKAHLLAGPVELDATYVGGLEANKHSKKKLCTGRGTIGKAAVAGIKDRKTKEIRAQVVPSGRSVPNLQSFVTVELVEKLGKSVRVVLPPNRRYGGRLIQRASEKSKITVQQLIDCQLEDIVRDKSGRVVARRPQEYVEKGDEAHGRVQAR